MSIKTIGVVGAGVMGSGVAHHFAKKGYDIVLVDVNEAKISESKKAIAQSVAFSNLLNRETLDLNVLYDKIRFSIDFRDLENVDLVIENVTENLEVKRTLYDRLSKVCNSKAFFAVNTSVYSITQIASFTDRPDKVLGIHFMNPVPQKKYVELIKGTHTSEHALVTISNLLKESDISPILINDGPGFVSNRPLMVFINEAIFVLEDQIASAGQIDLVFKGCIEHKMGPLETADMIGLDTILYSLEALYSCYNDPKYRPAPLLKKLVYAGYLGLKSGKGFYNYTNTSNDGKN